MALSDKISWIKYLPVTIFYFRFRYTNLPRPHFDNFASIWIRQIVQWVSAMTMARTSELWTHCAYIHHRIYSYTILYNANLYREGAQLVANNKHIIIPRLWEEEVAKGGHTVCSTTWFTYPAERRDSPEWGEGGFGTGAGVGISCAFASSKFARKVANLAKNSKHAAVNTWGFNWLIGYLWLCVALSVCVSVNVCVLVCN